MVPGPFFCVKVNGPAGAVGEVARIHAVNPKGACGLEAGSGIIGRKRRDGEEGHRQRNEECTPAG
jgi:hypothetical protein